LLKELSSLLLQAGKETKNERPHGGTERLLKRQEVGIIDVE
jgi:hypothetical protein